MVYGDLQFFDIIIFAVIAVFIIYRLRSVLGKRTGFQKNTNQQQKEFIKKETNNKKTIIFKALEEDVALHKKTVSEIKEAVWKKYNY